MESKRVLYFQWPQGSTLYKNAVGKKKTNTPRRSRPITCYAARVGSRDLPRPFHTITVSTSMARLFRVVKLEKNHLLKLSISTRDHDSLVDLRAKDSIVFIEIPFT